MRTLFAILIAIGGIVFFLTSKEDSGWTEPQTTSAQTRLASGDDDLVAFDDQPEPGTELVANEAGRVSMFFASGLAGDATEGALSVQGRVLDARGRGIGGLTLSVQASSSLGDTPEPLTATCDAQGQFVLTTQSPFAEIACADDRWMLLFGTQDALADDVWRCILVAAPTKRCAGVVVDASGRRIAGATLSIDGRVDLTRRYGLSPHQVQRTAISDHDGAFDLGLVPLIEPARLEVSADEFALKTVELEAGTEHELRIVLTR